MEAYRQVPDEEIIKLILLGEHPALYEVLYKRYHQKVLDKCYSLLGNRDLALDFTQTIMTRIFEKLADFQFRSSFSSWVYSITYHHCIDYLRKKKKLHYPEWNMIHEIPEIVDEVEFDDEPDPDQFDQLMAILDNIHPEEKALLMMKYFDNLSHKEIGQALQITESAAKMRLKRAKARVMYLYKMSQQTKSTGRHV